MPGDKVMPRSMGENEWGDPATIWVQDEAVEVTTMSEVKVDMEADAGVMATMDRAGVAMSLR